MSVYLLSDDAADPQDGTLAAKIEGVVDHTEYRTIRLPQNIEIREGQKYAIVLKLPPGIGSFYDSKCYKAGVSYSAEYAAENEAAKPEWNDCYTVGAGDVCIHVYTEYEGETEQFIPGDMNRDGRLTAADLSLMKQAIRTPERSDLYQPAADWNGDSEINAEDAHGLLNYLLTASEQESLKIRLTGSTDDEHDEAFRRQMQDAVKARVLRNGSERNRSFWSILWRKEGLLIRLPIRGSTVMSLGQGRARYSAR